MTPATSGKDFGDMPMLAPLRERLGELASRNIFVGTSSWKYEGWLGQLYSPERYEYSGKIAKTRFEAECLPNTRRRFALSALMPFLVMDSTHPKKSISRDAYDLFGFYIICTSNIGSQQLLRPTTLPFTTLELAVVSELHKFVPPELIERFDEKWSPSYLPRTHNARSPSSPKSKNSGIRVPRPARHFTRCLGPLKKTVQKFNGHAIRDAMKAGAQAAGVLAVSPFSDSLKIRGGCKQDSES